jgi:hypothetical protein
MLPPIRDYRRDPDRDDNPPTCGTDADVRSQRSLPPVDPADARLALLLRKIQWLCDSLAHAVPSRRADPNELARLMDQLPALEHGLRGYAARRITITDGETSEQ